MSSGELRKKFLEFFKNRGHKIVPSSSLIPDDPSVLLTTAGMQQFKPYFLGKSDPMKDFGARRTASIQKSFRTSDIDEVGDDSHLTFFEMLGHFSFGDYFKKETIEWTYELLTEVFKIAPERISATVFAGDAKIPFDAESYAAWSKFLPPERIRKGPRMDNVWGPAGPEGPCGAANEVYVDNLEVATLVFMEYFCAKDQSLTPLPQKGVDVGWGFERLAMIIQGKKNIFETDLFQPFGLLVQAGSKDIVRSWRIIADHLRGLAFLLADGVRPSNKEAGYVLRRLLRRLLIHANKLSIRQERLEEKLEKVIKQYGKFYPRLIQNRNEIFKEFLNEASNTKLAIGRSLKGLDELSKKFPGMVAQIIVPRSIYKIFNPYLEMKKIAKEIFDLHQTYALPLEDIKEYLKGKLYRFDDKEFDNALAEEIEKHQEISRAGVEKKFGGHGLLLDTGELKAKDEEELKKVTRLHTATHLLQAALRKVLGESVNQAGSDITAERTRFDFTFERKLTDEEIKKVEDLVNFAVGKKYQVEMKEMAYEEAMKLGALSVFSAKGGEKYPPKVKVYSVGDFKADPPEIFSRELCGGPHVKNTSEIGHFKILKQEAVGSGLRRLRATVE